MKTLKDYLEMVQSSLVYEKNKKYNYTWESETPKPVEYLGTIKENPGIKPNSTEGDILTDKPTFLFRWLTGDNAISSFGQKGDVIALGKNKAKQRIKEI